MVTDWLVEHGPASGARARIVCVPYAGGGTAVFHPWRSLVPAEVVLSMVRLPGRESRFRETPIVDLDMVIDDLAPLLAGRSAVPLVIFGYSLGALLGYELAVRLHSIGAAPSLLIVGGAQAPHVPPRREPLSEVDDNTLIASLRDLDGTPSDVFDHPELLGLLLPMLRADFALLDRYRRRDNPLLPMPIVTYSGCSDRELTAHGIAAWADLTAGATRHRSFDGGHFFLNERPADVVAAMMTDLAEFVS